MYSDWGVFNIDMYLVDCDSACLFQIEKKLAIVPSLLMLFTGNRLACNAGVLVGKVRVTSLQSFVQLAMFDVELEWIVRKGQEKMQTEFPKSTMIKGMCDFYNPPLPSPFFWPSLTLSVQISLSSQSFAAMKIKDGSFNFQQENMKHC